MTFEVEQKFPVADLAAVEQRLLALGAEPGEPVHQADRYFNHPCRDFAETDEALRIRQVGNKNYITFKGPKVDATTKTRREIELPLATGPSEADAWEQLLLALGFSPVACVRKLRRKFDLAGEQATVEIVLDDVEGVGQFVELELAAEEDTLDAAREQILKLASQLQLSRPERRSYLEMFLARNQQEAPTE
ncbi:MAG: class IV adenylate cyclase [Planctomycetes bacterium]|nr:class IV adenylate cyclase [Planctomycetota bacterium]